MKINGKVHEGGAESISEMLSNHEFDEQYVVVEVNGEIIPKSRYESVSLGPDDTVEVISFVGGG